MYHSIYMRSLGNNIHRDRKQNGGKRGAGVGVMGSAMGPVSAEEGKEVEEMDGGDGCTM